MEKNKKLRITLDVSQKTVSRIDNLRELLEIDTKAGVIRQALQLYEYLLKETIEGKKIFIGNDKENITEALIFFNKKERINWHDR